LTSLGFEVAMMKNDLTGHLRLGAMPSMSLGARKARE
jgi:hypothetical protein